MLKFSRGVASGSCPLSLWMTICCTILSSSSQYWTVLPLLLSAGKEGGETDVSKGEVVALLGRRAGLPSLQQALGGFPGLCWDSQGIWRQWCRMDIKCGYASLCVSLFLVSSNICVALLVSMWTCGQQPGKVRPLHPQQHHLFPKSQLQTP